MISTLLGMTIIFLILLFLGVPIFISMSAVTMIGILFGTDLNCFLIIRTIVSGMDSFVLLAVPGFILAGQLMNASGITMKLVDFAEVIMGRFRGGLAYAAVITNMIMAGVSGSAISDAASIGSVLIPAMVKSGYPKDFSAAINAAASTIGPIIPPSTMFILFGAITGVSIGRLFVGGAIPGVMMGIFFIIVCGIIAKHRNFPVGEKTSFKKILRKTKGSFFALLMPFILIGGLVSGAFTPTEASAIAVFLAVVTGVLVYRGMLKLTDFPQILKNTAVLSGTVLILVGAAQALGWIIAYLQVSRYLTDWFMSISQNKIVILLLINLILLFLGCFMDIIAILVILTPILMPVIYSLGVDPVHFGVFYVLNLMIGLITPPVGIVMYVTCGIADVKMKDFIKNIYPFWIALIILLIIITLVPKIVLWLPSIVF